MGRIISHWTKLACPFCETLHSASSVLRTSKRWRSFGQVMPLICSGCGKRLGVEPQSRLVAGIVAGVLFSVFMTAAFLSQIYVLPHMLERYGPNSQVYFTVVFAVGFFLISVVFNRLLKLQEDEMILSDGYIINPADIENCLLIHPEVSGVGVIGKPDELRTEITKAFVVRKPGATCTTNDLIIWVKDRLSAYSHLNEVTFIDALPLTLKGTLNRADLKARAKHEVEACKT